MRHRVKKKHFSRTAEQRVALMRSLARSLILFEKIESSEAKLKALRPFVERLITLAKKGDLASRRRALSLLPDKEAIRKLFTELAPRFEGRNGGYTRIVKLPNRKPGDSTELAIIEFVE
ncbi:ribosomal protein L17 [Hydrogenobaculum sp. Y04AAS1]|jgi:large subunit ribosomal protein L17|uniref:Large ribosomal subunit protein bL17 n=1 Tax=Hydrogenobaculum sp. (strain Y04AAS1) TaxID=380749 RepID=RL17_HYDS0|nr:RecName: Full=Large ribosomal subunit protein bL17; AltName: Full=50S ribosomal protein L17 [Hydrogenobaculum sp. Y04AAS1]ACG56984.1 ribosomal protein L17 [Hydrogenobaculum sp. Y04AAS1]HCT66616.1 50S ribosomal protein L17 [Hydrogenobaculum sp.]